jgi:hypothetical protein
MDERQEMAKIIINNKVLEHESFDYSLLQNKIDNIYDLFDTIGFFVKNKFMKADVAHEYFDYWFCRYYQFFKFYEIKKLAGFEETVWNNLSKLSHELDIIEVAQFGKRNNVLDKKELEIFFNEEQSEE